jgi:hypothetical protein
MAYQEVVGCRFGDTITNSPSEIVRRLERGDVPEPLTRERMQLMASFDLGQNWVNMASGPTLFLWDPETDDLQPAGANNVTSG